MYNPQMAKLGRFSQNDGTIDFYLRVRSVVRPDFKVVDLGAGRGAWFEDDKSSVRRELRYLTPLVKEFVAIDVDDAVMLNRTSTANIVYDGAELPFEDNSVDVILADYVLEHIDNPIKFAEEITRVLKPGGYLCARTPHKWNYVSIGARLIGNSHHDKLLSKVQPSRKEIDIFPTTYKLNTLFSIKEKFAGWDDHSFLFRVNPSYYFGNKIMYHALAGFHRVLPIVLVSNMFIFLKRPENSVSSK